MTPAVLQNELNNILKFNPDFAEAVGLLIISLCSQNFIGLSIYLFLVCLFFLPFLCVCLDNIIVTLPLSAHIMLLG